MMQGTRSVQLFIPGVFGCEHAPGFPGVVVMKKCVCTYLSTYLCLFIHTHMRKSIKHKTCVMLLRR